MRRAKAKIDRTIVGWRAWYSDNRYYDSTTTRWEDLPDLGVLYIIVYQKTRPYSRIMSGTSLYWIEETPGGRIYANDDAADAILPEGAKEKRWLKRGKWVTDDEFGRAFDAAQEAMDTAPDESLRIDKWQ